MSATDGTAGSVGRVCRNIRGLNPPWLWSAEYSDKFSGSFRSAAKRLELSINIVRRNGLIPRVRHMIDWLTEAFNPVRFPWLKDEFIHPNELKTVY
jgi:hypothetical protein